MKTASTRRRRPSIWYDGKPLGKGRCDACDLPVVAPDVQIFALDTCDAKSGSVALPVWKRVCRGHYRQLSGRPLQLGSVNDTNVLMAALQGIVARSDCDYNDFPDDRTDPCSCPRCVAEEALKTNRTWRYVGNAPARRKTNPRERKIAARWRDFFEKRLASPDPDLVLRDILRLTEFPTPHDWLVATSVVQWLTTNVGRTILEEAGWKYQEEEQDRKEIDKRWAKAAAALEAAKKVES